MPLDDQRTHDKDAHPADDWMEALRGPFRSRFMETIRDLSLGKPERLPPPRSLRNPFGHEVRILSRYRQGKNNLRESSAFSSVYQRVAAPRVRDAFRALFLNQPLEPDAWENLIGREARDEWIAARLLREEDGRLRSRFGAFPLGEMVLLADAPKLREFRPSVTPIGNSSFHMIGVLTGERLGHRKRYLDVGPGSGSILLSLAQHCDESIGIDIDPRAVKTTTLNIELNGCRGCRAIQGDVFEVGKSHGFFDLITWNSPYCFLPHGMEWETNAYGGAMGIEISVRFFKLLHDLLTEDGVCFVEMIAPILESGENLLESELRALSSIDTLVHVGRARWFRGQRSFHEEHGIKRFETVLLELTHGTGRLERVELPISMRMADLARSPFRRSGRPKPV